VEFLAAKAEFLSNLQATKRSTFVQLFFRQIQAECPKWLAQHGANSSHLKTWAPQEATLGVTMNLPDRADREQRIPLADVDDGSESKDEARKIRRLQMMMSMVMSVISQDSSLTVEEASELAAGAKRAALAMFPDKELAYDLLYKPRLQRLMRERFRLQ